MAVRNANIDLGPMLAALSDIERKNLPFAKAVALNNTAFQAKDALIGAMPGKFNMRSTRSTKGFRVQKANKRDAIPAVMIYHLDDWMAIHEFGGIKQPTKGKRMAVPSKLAQEKGLTGSGKMSRRWRSSTMRLQPGFASPKVAGSMGGRGNKGTGLPKPFLLVSKNGERRIVRRTTRGSKGGRKGSNRYDLIDLYYIKKSVKVKPVWHYLETVKAVASKRLALNLVESLSKAVASSTR